MEVDTHFIGQILFVIGFISAIGIVILLMMLVRRWETRNVFKEQREERRHNED